MSKSGNNDKTVDAKIIVSKDRQTGYIVMSQYDFLEVKMVGPLTWNSETKMLKGNVEIDMPFEVAADIEDRVLKILEKVEEQDKKLSAVMEENKVEDVVHPNAPDPTNDPNKQLEQEAIKRTQEVLRGKATKSRYGKKVAEVVSLSKVPDAWVLGHEIKSTKEYVLLGTPDDAIIIAARNEKTAKFILDGIRSHPKLGRIMESAVPIPVTDILMQKPEMGKEMVLYVKDGVTLMQIL